jgi:hypothetical protein
MAKSSSGSKAGGCQCADAQNLRGRGALRYAVPAPRKPWVSIALRSPCSAQALGDHPWSPAGRMRPAHGHPCDAKASHPSDRVAAEAGIVEDYPQEWAGPVDFLGSGRYFGVTAA